MAILNDDREEPSRQVRPETRSIFVGREREFEELRRGLEEALSGNGRMFLVAGEPGIGKTRLANELAQHGAGRGVQSIWGRCWEGGGAAAYWPWRQIIRTCLRFRNASTLVAELGSCANDLEVVAPEARNYIAKDLEAAPLPTDPEQARFRLFDSFSTFLNLAAINRPLLIVLEDLHAADLSSLFFLRFLSRNLNDSGILIVGTYRDAELRQAQARADLLGQLASDSSRISLNGLNEDEVQILLREEIGPNVDSKAVSAIYNATGGNPLFVKEISRCAIVPGGPAFNAKMMPNGVRAAIQRHLSPLSTEARQVLSVASVIGSEFDCTTLQRLSELTVEHVLEAIAEAENARLVSLLPGKTRRWRFAHSLIRDCLYEDVPKKLASQLHSRIGGILEASYYTDPEVSLAEIAHHFVQGGSSDTTDKAAYYACEAARHAKEALAYEEAASLFQLALNSLEQQASHDHRRRTGILLELAHAERNAGAIVNARATFKAAGELAQQIGADEMLGRAALGLGATVDDAHIVDSEAVQLTTRALAALGNDDSALRAQLLAQLAVKSYLSHNLRYRSELIQQAVEIAHRLNDRECLLFVLDSKRRALWEPENIEERLSTVKQALQLAEETGNRKAALNALMLQIIDLAEMGDFDQVRIRIPVFARSAEELRQPYSVWEAVKLSACQAIFEGRYEEGDRLANRAFVLGQGLGSSDPAFVFFSQLAVIYRDKARLAEVESTFCSFAESHPDVPVFRCTAAYIRSELGRDTEAKLEFMYLMGPGFASLPRRGVDWPVVLMLLGELCCYLDDKSQAQTLYRLLSPFADRNITSFYVVSFGSAATYLGKLAALLGRFEQAAAHFEAALRFNERTGGRPWLAETQYEYAQMLLLRNLGSDRLEAERLLFMSADIARTIGSIRLGSKLASCMALHGIDDENALTLQPGGGNAENSADESGTIAIGTTAQWSETKPRHQQASPFDASIDFKLSREGDYWTISFKKRVVRLKHLRGFEYIETLLGNPGREFHALNLTSSVSAGEDKRSPESSSRTAGSKVEHEELNVVTDLGDAGEMLDANAKKAYRRRLLELNDDLAAAKERGNVVRAVELEEEIEALSKELRRAVGLMGRDRVAGSASERARISVTRAIKTAVDRLAEHDEKASRFLGRTIRTGTFCCYLPDRHSWWE